MFAKSNRSSKDAVRQAAIREREILLGATRVFNDTHLTEDSVLSADDGPPNGLFWERSYEALGR